MKSPVHTLAIAIVSQNNTSLFHVFHQIITGGKDGLQNSDREITVIYVFQEPHHIHEGRDKLQAVLLSVLWTNYLHTQVFT